MRGETGEEGRPTGPPGALWRPVRLVAGVAALSCLVLGLVLGRITAVDPSDASVPVVVPSDTQPTADPSDDEVEVAVAGAVEVRPAADLVPAAVGHLTVVAVSATTCGERTAGSGVVVDTDTVLTAAHVVGDAGLVRISHGAQVFTGEVRGVLRDGRDIAIVELLAPVDAPVAVGPRPLSGEAVTVVGHPEGEARTTIVGPVVDVPERAAQVLTGDLLAVDAASRSGMSGGPAVDAEGALVGLLVAAQPATGTAVVVGIDDLAAVLDAPLVDGRCPETV